MPQSDNLYFAITGWSDGVLNENDPYRRLVFANPYLTDGKTNTNIVKSNNVDFIPYSNFEDAADEYTTAYKLTWGQDTRHIEEHKSNWGNDAFPEFYETGVGNVAQGYFGNLDPVALDENEALVMEFNVNSYNISEGASMGFGVMMPPADKLSNAYNFDDYYTTWNIGSNGYAMYTYGQQNIKQLNVTGTNMIDNAYQGVITDPNTNAPYLFTPASFMGAGKTVKLVYVPYSYGADGVKSQDDLGGSFTVWSKDMTAPSSAYQIAYSVTDLGEGARKGGEIGQPNLFIVMYINMAHGVQSLTISNHTVTVREISADRDKLGANVQTGDILESVNPGGTSFRKAVKSVAGVYTYYVNREEIKPSIGANNGDGFVLYADRFMKSGETLDKAYSALYYNHGDKTNDKLSSSANISFDVLANDGLKLVLGNKKNSVDGAQFIDVPKAENKKWEVIDGDNVYQASATPTTKYRLSFEDGNAILSVDYNVVVEDIENNVVIDRYVESIPVLDSVESKYSDFYLGFYVETTGGAKIASLDNVHVQDDPAVIGVNELDFLCTFDMGLPPSKFTTDVAGDNSIADITDGSHTVAVTNGSLLDQEAYSLLVGDGAVVTFIADPAETGKHFDRWETADGEVYAREAEVTVVVAKNISLKACYELDEHVINIIDGGNGKIVFYEGNTVDLTTITAKYGESVRIEATKDIATGEVFVGWYNGADKVSSDLVYSFEVKATYDKLEARYANQFINLQVINATAMPEGGLDQLTSLSVEYGTVIVATPTTANAGWEFGYWEFNGVKVTDNVDAETGALTYTLTEDGTLNAIFIKKTYNVTVNGGYIDGDKTVSTKAIAYGETVIISANAPEEGKKFEGWYSGSVKVSSDADYIVEVTKAINVTAKYTDADETANSGCAGFIAPPTSNGGGNNSVWLVASMLVVSVIAVAFAKRNRASKENK